MKLSIQMNQDFITGSGWRLNYTGMSIGGTDPTRCRQWSGRGIGGKKEFPMGNWKFNKNHA